MTRAFFFALGLIFCAACADPLPPPYAVDSATRAYLAQFLPFNNILSVDHFMPPQPGSREFALHFSQPMAPLSEIGKQAPPGFATIKPETPGVFAWLHPKTLIFSAAAPFTPGTRYEIRVAAGLESLGGAVLVKETSFPFTPPLDAVAVPMPKALNEGQAPEAGPAADETVPDPIRVDVDAPATLRVGDRFLIRAVIANSGGLSRETVVSWKSAGLRAECGNGAAVRIAPGGFAETSCFFSSNEDGLKKAGFAWESRSDFTAAVPLEVKVSDGVLENAETISIAVRNERYVVKSASGLADPEARAQFQKPADALADFGGLDLRFNNRGSREVTSAKIFLNGERIILSSLDPLRPEDGVFIPTAKLPEVMTLDVSRQKGSALSYGFTLSYALPEPPGAVIEKGVSVSRLIFDARGVPIFGPLRAGEEYEVKVAVYADGPVADLSLSEALPAGAEFLSSDVPSRRFSGGLEFSLGKLPSGLTRVSYRFRADRPGNYFWPRSEAFDRANPLLSGTSGSLMIGIE